MVSLSAFIINVVNPRFRSFDKPLLLALVVGSATLVLTGAFFGYQFLFSETCSAVNFPTPQRTVEESLSQYTAGFNDQVTFVKNMRFGGTYARCHVSPCGIGGTVASNGLAAALGDPMALPPADTPMFYVEQTTTEELVNNGRTVTVNTLKRTERAMCLSDVSAFIVADVSRQTAATSNVSTWGPTGGTRDNYYVSDVIHNFPQIGSWHCNPPNEFYQLKMNEMAGEPFFDPAGNGPTDGHYAAWVDDNLLPNLVGGASTYLGHPLPVCGMGGPDGLQDANGVGLGQPPPVGVNTMPFYGASAAELAWGANYGCNARAAAGGNELPVIASYRIFTTTSYNVTWSPASLCEPTPLLTALGTALAYSTYFEMVCTLLVIGVLLQAQTIRMAGRVGVGELASGDLDQEALNERIKKLEQTASRVAA